MMKHRNTIVFWAGVAIFLAAVLSMTQIVRNEYPFFAGYVILQFIALAVAWSILGGYAGYVNFGTNAFSASASTRRWRYSRRRARRSWCRSPPPRRSAWRSALASAC